MSSLPKAVSITGRNPVVEQNAVLPTAAALLVLSAWGSVGVLLGALFAVFLAVFWRTAWSIGETWYSSRTFSHGFLILPMAAYLVWVRRKRLATLCPQPNYWGLPLLIVLSGVWLLASLGDVRVVQQFALVAMLIVAVWTLLGTAVVRALWFPLAFLFFAVPFGESAIGPLQDFTAHFAVSALGLSRVPAILENRTIWVPSGPWVVAEACSGIRYLISSFVLGLIYASVVYRSSRRRVIFVLASLAVPIVANGLRAYGIILLAYLTNNRLAVGVDHVIYGWIFFTAVQLLLFSVGLKWRESPTADSGGAGTADRGIIRRSLRKVAVASVLVLLLVSMGPLAAGYLERRASAEPAPQFAPRVKAAWRPFPSLDRTWAPLLHPGSELSTSYVSDGARVDLYLAGYSGTQKVELVGGYNRVSDQRLWSEFAGGYRGVVIDGQTTKVRWDTIQSDSGSRLVWTWYCVHGKFTANETEVKFLQAKSRLIGQPATTAVISLSASYLLDPSQAASRMEDFLRHTSFVLTPTTGR